MPLTQTLIYFHRFRVHMYTYNVLILAQLGECLSPGQKVRTFQFQCKIAQMATMMMGKKGR